MMEEPIRGQVVRSRQRIDRRTVRELGRVQGSSLVDRAELNADASHAAARLDNGVQLGHRAMAGVTMLRRSAITMAAGDEELEDQLKMIGEAVTFGARDVVYNYINGRY